MRRTECDRCSEDVLLIGYVPPESNRVVEVACDPEPVLFLTANGGETKVFVMVAGYRRHRDSCEALQGKLDTGAAALPDEAGDEAGEIDEAKAAELSAELPKEHEPPSLGTS